MARDETIKTRIRTIVKNNNNIFFESFRLYANTHEGKFSLLCSFERRKYEVLMRFI
jgi:hypothetical protein